MLTNGLPVGGHAPGHLRAAFEEALEERDLPTLRRAAGRLWCCTDVMPRDVCSIIGIPQGANYAQGARQVRTWSRI